MIKDVHDEGGGTKVTELAEKFSTLTFSITERF
jgi:hypothetical protein